MVTIIIENRYYPIEFLKEKLGSSFEEIINLCDMNRIINRKPAENSLAFQFVGMLFHHDITLLFLPKYIRDIKDINEKEYTSILLKVLHKYQKSLLEIEYDNEMIEEIEDKRFHLLGTISFILHSYADYGLYVKKQEVQDIVFEGEIEWDSTISNSNVYLTSDNKPIYLDLIKSYSETDYNAKITDLHKFLLNQCTHFMQSNNLDIIFNWPKVSFETFYDWENNYEEAISLLKKEMLVEFQDQRLRLLQNLKFYFEQLQSMSYLQADFMVGTKYFHNVWEKCCANVLGHDLTIQMNITKPKWSMGTELFRSEKSLIPDFLKQYTFNEMNLLLIFDSKYYTLKYNSSVSSVMNTAPGVGDITKQYMYQNALSKYAEDNMIHRIYNAFLLPTPEEIDFQIKGAVQFDFITNIEPIKLIYLDAKSLFINYLNDRVWSKDKIDTLIIELQKNH